MKRIVDHVLVLQALKLFGRLSALPFAFHRHEVGAPPAISHTEWAHYLEANFNKPGMRILEIGSRKERGQNMKPRFSRASHTGFDIYPGIEVDIVGDAHKLSDYFPGDKRFDLIFSSAVFEHLYMPWVVAEEIGKLLKVGGHVFVETHFSFAAHERPWNFFQFSDLGLRALFNTGLGFEVIDAGMCNPMVGYFAPKASRYLRYRPIPELYCHSAILARKVQEARDFSWSRLDASEAAGGTIYPPARST